MEYYGAPSSQFLPRASFLLLFSVSIVTVSVPVLLFIHRPFWVVWVLAVCLFTAIINLSKVWSRQVRSLTNLERVLLVVAVLFEGSSIALAVALGFIPLKLYSLWYTPGSFPGRILWYFAVANACFFLLGGLLTVGKDLLEALFPKTGVGNAFLFPGFTWRKLAFPGFLGLTTIAVLGLLASLGWSYAYLGMIIALMIMSAPVSSSFDRQKHPVANSSVLEAMKALLMTCGYTIFERLQTGQPALDRLIALFDLVAYKDGNALALQFKTDASNSAPVMWTEASALRTACWAIYRGAEKQQAKLSNVQPVLVLFGRAPDASLSEFAKEESIGLAIVPEDAPLERITKGEFTSEQLRELARLYLPMSVDASPNGQAVPKTQTESATC